MDYQQHENILSATIKIRIWDYIAIKSSNLKPIKVIIPSVRCPKKVLPIAGHKNYFIKSKGFRNSTEQKIAKLGTMVI